MKSIVIANNFTGNQTRVLAVVGTQISPAKQAIIRRRLHGAGCTSAGPLGERGPQSFTYEMINAEGWVQITSIVGA